MPLVKKLFSSEQFDALFGVLVPPLDERTPLTLSNSAILAVPPIIMLLMASLARVSGTWSIRLALLPVGLALTLRIYYGYYLVDGYYNGINHGIGSMAVGTLISLLDLGLRKEGALKLNEVQPGSLKKPLSPYNQELDVPNGTKVGQLPRHKTPISFLAGGIEYLTSVRGIGWKFGTGTGLHVASDWRDTSNRQTFLRQTLVSVVKSFFILDALNTALGRIPGLRVIGGGGSLFAFGSNPIETAIISTTLHCMTGFLLVSGFLFTHDLLALLAVAFLGGSPTEWPPIVDRPWASSSLHEFWSKRWHQVLRQPVLVLGGYPLQYILRTVTRSRALGDLGLVVGAFAASGFLHDWGFYHLGRTPGVPCIIYFTSQSIGLGLERAWRKMTGRRVSGWGGTLWVWIWIVGYGQWCIDSWYRAGLQSGLTIPAILSPTQSFVLPIVDKYLAAST